MAAADRRLAMYQQQPVLFEAVSEDSAQVHVFSVSANRLDSAPLLSLEESELDSVRIPRSARKSIRLALSLIGFMIKRMMTLDGLAQQRSWGISVIEALPNCAIWLRR